MKHLFWPLLTRPTWDQADTAVACTTAEGADLASIRSFSVGSVSHCGCACECLGHSSGYCSLGRRCVSQPLWCRARQVRALLWPLFEGSEWAHPTTLVAGSTGDGAEMDSVLYVGVVHPATVLSGTTGEGDSLTTDHLVGLGSASHCGGGHDR